MISNLKSIRLTIPATLSLIVVLSLAGPAQAQDVEEAPQVILQGVPFQISVTGGTSPGWVEVRSAGGEILGTGSVEANATLTLDGLRIAGGSDLPLSVQVGEAAHQVDVTFLPGWFSILPPLIAILLALVFKEVITALFAGVWLGALAIAGFNPISATWRVMDQFALPALSDPDHGSIVLFSLLLGGMVGVISKHGGTHGIVEAVSPFARTKRRGKVATWAAGLGIFFDDYANTLIVGNTMRPVTDRLKISREKLAYLVDSTAAPVAALVPVSTWVGYEISLIGDGMQVAAAQQAANPDLAASLSAANPFTIFISSIPYLFYPLLALAFVFLTSVMNRDLGPMAKAEARAAAGKGLLRDGAMPATDTSGDLESPKEGAPHRWTNAMIPVLAVIVVVLGGLYTTGRAALGDTAGASLMDIFGEADPFVTLLWGSLAGCLVAIVLSVGQKILTVHECIQAWLGGLRAMIIAIVILVLAWSLGAVTGVLGTADYLSQVIGGALPLQLMPAVVFVTAAAIAFATGTSWGTMAILLPLAIPLTISLGGGPAFDFDGQYFILVSAISSVLAGAIFGDHCSPISDTTVMSSMASGCDHVDHVQTQLPYALLVATMALLASVGSAYGVPGWIFLILGVGLLFLVLKVWGKTVEA